MDKITQKRLKAIYDYRYCNSTTEKLLDIILAIINKDQIKIVFDELNLKIK